MRPELFTIPILNFPVKSYGFMLMIGFLSGVWFAMRRAERVKADPDMVLNCGFVALIAGVLGARIFYVVHYWKSQFAPQPSPLLAAINITAGGMEAYGGLLLGAVCVLAYLLIKRKSWRLYLDIAAPAGMWGLGITRIGCFLNGCCWGAVCVNGHHEAAVPWAVRFPFGSNAVIQQWEDRQLGIPAELLQALPSMAVPLGSERLDLPEKKVVEPKVRLESERRELLSQLEKAKAADPQGEEARRLHDQVQKKVAELAKHKAEYADLLGSPDGLPGALDYPSRAAAGERMSYGELRQLAASFRSLPVHPTQLYAAIDGILISLVLSSIFYRRKHHGVVIGWLFVLYGMARIVEESIRIDNPLDSGGMTVSQFVSFAMIALGVVYLVIVRYYLPARSPLAVPYVPPAPEPAAQRAR
ncbi:MAG TPA: prolipoprotein diacylglyceryl transferase [Phycisphaerae bacterium]|jgi:phosphatidylglycerol:prolipoprotein diacylglycerol transferase